MYRILLISLVPYAAFAINVAYAEAPTSQPSQPLWCFGINFRLTEVQHGAITKGLLITAIRRSSPAKLAGLEEGDIVLFANRRRFCRARDDHDAMRILQESVCTKQNTSPSTVTQASGAVRPAAWTPKVIVQYIDHRTGRRLWATVYPVQRVL